MLGKCECIHQEHKRNLLGALHYYKSALELHKEEIRKELGVEEGTIQEGLLDKQEILRNSLKHVEGKVSLLAATTREVDRIPECHLHVHVESSF